MLWLCLRLPRLAHEARTSASPTTPRSEPSAALPATQAALERLAGWAYQWSSQVSYRLADEPLLWLETGASAALFGGQRALIRAIETELQQLGYSHTSALAPSPSAAALLTQAEPPRCVHTRGQLLARLRSLPLSLLALPPEVLTALAASGLRRIGELLSLPAAALARRFEAATTLYLQQLTGQVSEPLPSWQLPAVYRTRCEFGSELHATTALLFVLRRLLLEFQGYLRARDVAVLRFTLLLEHHQRPATRLSIGLSAPSRDGAQMLQVARERLQALTLPAAVTALALEALEFTAPSVLQTDLFGSPDERLQQLQLLLDRLRARLGEEQIQGLQCLADYRPERAGLAAPPQARRAAGIDSALAARPCALLATPRALATPPTLLSGPERIESGWWDGEDAARDYYVARAADGARLWVYRDLHDGRWYLQGLWA